MKAILEQTMKVNAKTNLLKDELSHVNTRLDGVTNLLHALYNKLANEGKFPTSVNSTERT